MSYASTASDLSNKQKYPLLFNMVPPDSAHNNAIMAFLKYFKWNRIATIRQNDDVFDEVTVSISFSFFVFDFASPSYYKGVDSKL